MDEYEWYELAVPIGPDCYAASDKTWICWEGRTYYLRDDENYLDHDPLI